jgi:galacturan 1,4-alpha-galacturonidase
VQIELLQIDGTILAPPEVSSWPKSSLFQWINFKWVQNFTIKGYGTIDGQGSNWWSSTELYDIQVKVKPLKTYSNIYLRQSS